jgi:hypothetical protein
VDFTVRSNRQADLSDAPCQVGLPPYPFRGGLLRLVNWTQTETYAKS